MYLALIYLEFCAESFTGSQFSLDRRCKNEAVFFSRGTLVRTMQFISRLISIWLPNYRSILEYFCYFIFFEELVSIFWWICVIFWWICVIFWWIFVIFWSWNCSKKDYKGPKKDSKGNKIGTKQDHNRTTTGQKRILKRIQKRTNKRTKTNNF